MTAQQGNILRSAVLETHRDYLAPIIHCRGGPRFRPSLKVRAMGALPWERPCEDSRN
jgi:hypothetical protein